MGDVSFPGFCEDGRQIGFDGLRFRQKIEDLFLVQHIDQFTRQLSDHQPSTLDLVFTLEENPLHKIEYGASLGKSDHVCILLNFIVTKIEQIEKRESTKG